MYKTSLLSLIVPLLILSCTAQATENIMIQNNQEPQTQAVITALKNKSINIIQLGDSHTAADFMTDAIRNRLQQKLGNGGPGWAMPVSFSGMRLARFTYHQQGWQTFSSRNQHDQDYTLGGLSAKPNVGATLTLGTRQPEKLQTVTLNIKQGPNDDDLNITDADGRNGPMGAPVKNNQWQLVRFNARLPIKVTAGLDFQTEIGGWWARNEDRQGAVYSALGINGAQLTQMDHWNTTAWQQALNSIAPDLIVLAYGTNEAYNNKVDIAAAQHVLIEKIHQIRTASPHSAIMLVGAPESLQNTAGACGTRPLQLTAFQEMQRHVALSEHTLYWDWQAAMGGECSMSKWINAGLARKDGVHFTQTGYQQLGEALANAILTIHL